MAGLLVAVFSLSLIAPALLAGDSNLLACCRRLGAHRCALVNTDAQGASFVQERCPQFLPGSATLTDSALASVTPSGAISASIVSHTSAHAQTEALYRLSFSRARQKRGPPVLFA